MSVPDHAPTNPYLQALPEDPSDRDEQPTVAAGAPADEATWDDIKKETADELSEGADPRTGKQKKSKEAKPPVLTPKRPGLTGTATDYDKLLVVLEEQVAREHDGWPQWKIVVEAEKRYAELTTESHPKFVDQYVALMQCSWTPNRRFIRENIQAAACRRVPELAAIEELLRSHKDGRPTGRVLPLAVFERCALANLRPELRLNYEDFTGSNLELDWAYLGSPDMEVNRAHMREESVVRKTLKAMLERHSPNVVLDANLAVVRRIAERHADVDGFTDVGRYLVVDGTEIRAHVEQTVPVNAEHAAMIAGKTGAKFGFHGGRNRRKKHWVGFTLLIISDLKTGLPLIWKLIPANDREFVHIAGLLDELFRRAPWIDPEYLVGDSEYDSSSRLAFDLEQRYGIHPVFQLREKVGRDWRGPPRSACRSAHSTAR